MPAGNINHLLYCQILISFNDHSKKKNLNGHGWLMYITKYQFLLPKEIKVRVEVRVTRRSHFTVELPHECVYIIVYFFHLINAKILLLLAGLNFGEMVILCRRKQITQQRYRFNLSGKQKVRRGHFFLGFDKRVKICGFSSL